MHIKSSTLLGLISLVALTGAKLHWKCELLDTSQESSTKTTFVEYVKGHPPDPSISDTPKNPRTPRSTVNQKCRPRPKNGTIGQTAETEKMIVERKKGMIQSDVPASSFSGQTDVPHVKYHRKETHQTLDLNIGPGFEESNDPYGRSKQPVPKRFRPAELKGADEMNKPLTEHLDENVMPDFEIDEDDAPPVQEDLPWCPEDSDDDCETADLEKMSISELVEFKQKCETTVSTERSELIEKLIRTEGYQPGVPPPDRTDAVPPTGFTNCSTSPSELSAATLEKYQKECPCEDDMSKMNEEELKKFKEECLEPIEESGHPPKLIRKNSRCAELGKRFHEMEETEYKLYVKECIVPENINLSKTLIVRSNPECERIDRNGLSKDEFSKYQKDCLISKDCNDIDSSKFSKKEMIKYKKMCSPVTRKTNNVCDDIRIEEFDDEQFEKYKRDCILERGEMDCDSIDIKSLSNSEYERYKSRCDNIPIDCKNVDPKELSEKQYEKYEKECLPSDAAPPFDCDKVDIDNLSKEEMIEYNRHCRETKSSMNCRTINPEELNDEEYKRYQKECNEMTESECSKLIPSELSSEEYEKYERDCLRKEMNCSTADAREMTEQQYERFEKVCLKKKLDCKNVKVKELSEEEYEEFRRNCLKNPTKFDCSNVKVEELNDEEYKEYKKQCLRRGNDFDCDVKKSELTGDRLMRFMRECVRETPDCTDVRIEELNDEEYRKYSKKCLKRKPRFDCSNMSPDDLSGQELEKYNRECLDDEEFDCKTVEPSSLNKREYKIFMRKCVKNSDDCRDIKVEKLRGEEYEKYKLDCMRNPEFNCVDVKIEELNSQEYVEYKKECLNEEGELNCISIQSKKLSRKQFQEYEKKCLERKTSEDCNSQNPKEMTDEEYEEYKRNCLMKNTRSNCKNVNVDELSEEEYKKYEEECLKKKGNPDCDSINPDQLTSEEYSKYKRDCLESPESSMNCEKADINGMSEKEFRTYEEECLPKNRFSKDCDSINPDILSDEEYKRYKRACPSNRPNGKPDCDNINPDSLSDEEYSKYKRKCLDSPNSSNKSTCKDINPDELNKSEYLKYQKKCLSQNNGTPDCDSVDGNELSDEEFLSYKKKCSYPTTPGENVKITKIVKINNTRDGIPSDCLDKDSDECRRNEGGKVTLIKKIIINNGPPGSESSVIPPGGPFDMEACQKSDVDKMTDYEYNAYKKYCKVNFKGEDCDDVRVDKLNDEELREYVDKCGLFCGIDRKEILSKKQRMIFEERCEGDTNELEKDCKDIVIEKLGERMYGDFAEKCLEPIDACSLLKSRRLVRKVYNEYRLKCNTRIRPPGKIDCENADTERMTLEEYRNYQKKCGKNRKYDCDDVNVEDLSEQEYSEYTRRCEIDKRHEDCRDLEVDSLSREEYQKYLKKCGRHPSPSPSPSSETSDDDCDSIDTNEMSQEELLIYARKCRHNPDTIDEICGNVNWKSELELKKLCQENPSDRIVPPGGGPKNCSTVDVEKLNKEEYEKYRKDCSPTRKTFKPNCDDVDVDKLSDEEYRQYKRKCKRPKGGPDYPERPDREGCHTVKIEELSSDEYLVYKKRCLTPKTPGGRTPEPQTSSESDDCSNVDVKNLSSEEYEKYRKNCKPRRKTPDCSDTDTTQLSHEEYRIYQKECGSNPESETPGNPGRPSVTIQKTVEVRNQNTDCSSINVNKLTKPEYQEYRRRCDRERKSEKPDCDDIDVNTLSDEEYRIFKQKCESSPKETPNRPGQPSVTIEKTIKVEEPPRDGSPGIPRNIDDCSNVNIAKLTDDEYDEYRRKCKTTRKESNPDCKDIDSETLNEEQLEEYKKKCLNQPDEVEEVPPSRPGEMDCSDINLEDLDKEEFIAYKKRCGLPHSPPSKRPPGSPTSPEDNCDDINVEDLTSEEYLDYKRRCLKDKIPRRPGNPDKNCLNVDVNELTEKEYRTFTRRCPQPENVTVKKTVVVNKECQNKNIDEMTDDEYESYKKNCLRKPTIELTKTIKIVEGPPPPGTKSKFKCWGVDVNQMNEEELIEYQKKCKGYKSTFQYNCNSDVTNMTDLEFKKFRKECGKKPFDCDTIELDSLSKKDYSRYKRECGNKTDCSNARVERMSAQEFEIYRKKCQKPTTKVSRNDCVDVRVEELSKREYDEYKIRCKKATTPEPTPSKTIRRRIDCSIVDESMMSEEEYADFKKHCNVKVTTDRYRPGENIILTKKVNIRTGKEKFSCYDQDVDNMTDEEYSEFEKKCLSNPHFRFDCSTIDTSNLSREEFTKYQRECLKPPQPSIILEKKLILNNTREIVKDGCYNRDVNAMTDEEYGRYEVRCLGREPIIPSKPERKSSFDCHNVDLSQLSSTEIEEHIRRCRTRETASTPPPRRQSLQCSDVNTDELSDEAYQKWVKECFVPAKSIQLEKKLIINQTTPLLSGGETVIVEKYEIHEHLRPDDDEGYLEGNEGFGVRILTGIRKKVIKGRPDEDSESETGVILVKKVIHKIPGRRRPFDIDDKDDEGGVIEVKKLIMKTSQPEPETDDSEDIEEILRRPRPKVDPREEVVLLSVTNKHPHSYRKKNIPDEEEPTEIVKLVKNTKHPNATLREVRIRKHFGTGVPGEETVIHEIGGNDFKITRKTVMIPHKIRKMKSTTTTTTTPAEPEYYYDEEEVPEVITLVKVDKSYRPLRKLSKPEDEDDEYVDVKEDTPKSYVEFEGFVKVRGTPRKLRMKQTINDSGEEPDIREVTRKVVQGSEEDDFKGVKLRSHRKKLIMIRKVIEEIPDDSEHEVTVVKKLKIMKFGNEETENFDDDKNVEDDGKIIVKNRRRKVIVEEGMKRPGEDEEEEEFVEGRLAVRGRAPKKFRWDHRTERKGSYQPSVTERNSEFYRIGGSEEDDIERRRKRKEEEERPKALEEEEEDGFRRRKRPNEYEEDEEELRRRRKPKYEEEESEEIGRRRRPEGEGVIIKKLYGIGQNERKISSRKPENQGESVVLTKKKVLKYGSDREEIPDESDENEEIRLRNRKKFLHFGKGMERKSFNSGGDQSNPDGPNGEIVQVTKKKVFKIGPNGEKELVDEDEVPINIRKTSSNGPDQSGEISLLKRKTSYRVGLNGERDENETEGNEPTNGEMVKISKKKVYRIGPNGEKELVDGDEEMPIRKISHDIPDDGDDEIIMKKKKRRFYKIGPDGKRELIRTTEEDEPVDDDENEMIKLKSRQVVSGGNGKSLLGRKMSSYGPEDQNDDEMDHEQIIMKKKKKRFYRIGSNGKRELIREEEVEGGDKPSGEKTSGLLGESKSSYSPEPLNDVGTGEEIQMKTKKQSHENGSDDMNEHGGDGENDGMITHKKKRFYKIGPDGKKELIRTEGDDFNGSEDGQIVGMKKTKRFYKKGKDGKRELIRTEESGSNQEGNDNENDKMESNSEKSKVNRDDVSDDEMKPPGKNTKLYINRRGFFKGGHLSVPDESEESNVEDGMRNDKRRPANDGYEYEEKPRVKRTYVLDGNGNRKLVDEKTGDEESNLDLGKLLRPKRKVTETETVDRKHRESQYEQRRSSGMNKSSSKNGINVGSTRLGGKMQTYHKDRNLRTGGKSEEDIPDEK